MKIKKPGSALMQSPAFLSQEFYSQAYRRSIKSISHDHEEPHEKISKRKVAFYFCKTINTMGVEKVSPIISPTVDEKH